MKKLFKVIIRIMVFFIIVIFIFSSVLVIKGRIFKEQLPSILGLAPMTVLSGSMKPYMSPGDVIIVKKENIEAIKAGDVVTVYGDPEYLVTHRVMEIKKINGKINLITKGDANNIPDGRPVTSKELVGKSFFKIPGLGYIAQFLKSTQGIIVQIIFLMSAFIIIKINEKPEEDAKDSRRL